MSKNGIKITIGRIIVSLVVAAIGSFLIAGSTSLLLSACGIINEDIFLFVMGGIGFPLLVIFFLIALGTDLDEQKSETNPEEILSDYNYLKILKTSHDKAACDSGSCELLFDADIGIISVPEYIIEEVETREDNG